MSANGSAPALVDSAHNDDRGPGQHQQGRARNRRSRGARVRRQGVCASSSVR